MKDPQAADLDDEGDLEESVGGARRDGGEADVSESDRLPPSDDVDRLEAETSHPSSLRGGGDDDTRPPARDRGEPGPVEVILVIVGHRDDRGRVEIPGASSGLGHADAEES